MRAVRGLRAVRGVVVAIAAVSAVVAVGATTGSPAGAAASRAVQGPFQPYFPPPFTCTVHEFGEAVAPPLRGLHDDPLCVEYAKRDITITNGGAIRFLAAEPARVLIALPKCRYWQQDHWSVQFAPGTLPVISWDGSYWWDEGAGQAAAILANLRAGTVAINSQQAAALVAPYSRKLAQFFLAFGKDGPGGGYAGTIAFNPLCEK